MHDAVPGRVRLQHAPLRANPRLAAHVAAGLRELAGVRAVRINTVTASVLVEFAAPCSATLIRRAIASALISHPEEIRRPAKEPEGAAPPDNWHCLLHAEVAQRLRTDTTQGLSSEDVARRRAMHGPNELSRRGPRSILELVFEQVATLPVSLLGASTVLSVLTGGIADAAVILGVVVVNAAIATTTERRAEHTILALGTYRHQPVARPER